ncbi:MAG: glycoside hydrolase family 9 protein [Acidobacteriaceae bacterium]
MRRRAILRLLAGATAVRLSPLPLLGVEATSTGAVRFCFDQLGFKPSETKEASVLGAGDGASFRVHVAGGGRSVFEGSLSGERQDEASGDRIRVANFTSVKSEGVYRLEVNGTLSDPFPVGPAVYREALRSTVRAFYGQRCGCAVDLGKGYSHPTCHLTADFHASSGKSGPLRNAGGWHDAGDYGRYIVNSGITCGTLLWAWEMFPLTLGRLALGVPQTHRSLPDFLAEVLWNLDWMLTLQDSDGGVFHKQTSAHFCAFIMPERDTLPSEVIGTGAAPYKSTGATADFAAVMAIAARCYRTFDGKMADRFLAAARRAFAWLVDHPEVIFKNPASVATGEYSDQELSDERMWAAAELWRTTGESAYERAFLEAQPKGEAAPVLGAPGWSTVGSMAYWTYAMADKGDAELKGKIRAATRDAAARLIERAQTSGYGNTLDLTEYQWGSNGTVANHSLLLIMANWFKTNPEAVSATLGNLHYLLGRNCHRVSWVTQLGTRPFRHPHHRPSVADGIPEPWPGLLSGGPNRHPADDVARTLPAAPPMRMWIDHDGAYSMNEVAINWNAALVFLLAFANQYPRHKRLPSVTMYRSAGKVC